MIWSLKTHDINARSKGSHCKTGKYSTEHRGCHLNWLCEVWVFQLHGTHTFRHTPTGAHKLFFWQVRSLISCTWKNDWITKAEFYQPNKSYPSLHPAPSFALPLSLIPYIISQIHQRGGGKDVRERISVAFIYFFLYSFIHHVALWVAGLKWHACMRAE